MTEPGAWDRQQGRRAALDRVQVVPGSNGGADPLRLSMTKDQTQQTAEFKQLSTSKATTGGAGSSPSRPDNPMSPPAPPR